MPATATLRDPRMMTRQDLAQVVCLIQTALSTKWDDQISGHAAIVAAMQEHGLLQAPDSVCSYCGDDATNGVGIERDDGGSPDRYCQGCAELYGYAEESAPPVPAPAKTCDCCGADVPDGPDGYRLIRHASGHFVCGECLMRYLWPDGFYEPLDPAFRVTLDEPCPW